MLFIQINKIFKKINNFEETLRIISRVYDIKIIDAYGSLQGSIREYKNNKEFFIPNSYGQEDNWKGKFNFVILFRDEILIFRKNKVKSVKLNIKVDLNDFGGKRGFYLKKHKVLLRFNKEKYKNLPKENKNKKTENDASGPHFTIRY